MLFKDRIALVTGSTNNIGLGIARAFAREGAKVIIHSRYITNSILPVDGGRMNSMGSASRS